MSHLRESLNDLLRLNFIATYNSYKMGRRKNKITSQFFKFFFLLVFHAVNYPPSFPKRENTLFPQKIKYGVLQMNFTKIWVSLPTKV